MGSRGRIMKIPFFKTILAASAILTFVACGDDSSSNSADNKQPTQAIVTDQPSWIFTKDGQQYIIGVNGVVSDAEGNQVGVADLTNPSNVYIVAMDMSSFATDIDINSLTVILPTVITDPAWVMVADQNYVIYINGTVTSADGTPVGTMNFETQTITGLDGATVMFQNVDVNTLTVYQPNVKPVEISSSSVAPQPTSSATPVVSSSSVPKSSGSEAKSSSSVAVSSSSQASGFTIKYIQGGKSGSGWATRYWDCCKPHCAWPEHGGKARTCDAKGNEITDKSAGSMCDGGNAGTCVSQIPQVYNDTIAFAFAAVPGSAGGKCGKCFDLAFTGKGKYANDNNLAKLKGKHLIVIASNIGYDVAEGQFDIMIPGGGTGLFNGCASKMGWGPQGAQYGGLLSECETESNYTASKYKSCLTSKCEKSFANDPKAKEGCLFLANWMNAAGNPLHTYREVECPKELLDRF